MAKIIVVDDDENIIQLCKQGLETAGHQTIGITKSEELFQTIAKEQPDLIVMDLRIPGEQGLSLLRRMPKREDHKIPVIIFSGYINQEIEKEAFSNGASEVLCKTAGIKELLQKINRVLNRASTNFTKLNAEANNTSKFETILTVDDQPEILDLIEATFAPKGYKILKATEGKEAVEIVKNQSPNVVLLDMNLPDESGLDVLKEIKALNPKLGVVMATGVHDEEIAQKAIELGAYAYVTKPFDLSYLEMVVLSRLLLAC